MYSHIEPDGTPELSPRGTNDDIVEGAAPQLNSTNDEVDDDDPFSRCGAKRMELVSMHTGYKANQYTRQPYPAFMERLILETQTHVTTLGLDNTYDHARSRPLC
ncbi:hypothetical protein RHGRI_017514 [Rhododendron griersonianum]|uniref:Uncharacterized protein n=1 Tax=Rhododendron griersonianum TaxID=479676 RepID=A0AAV6JY65_9ERIC|nr:hypothetical protein RHGRI_017514 [Rhododendron griersonianum]